jgi:carboxymethylenebutenolidase
MIDFPGALDPARDDAPAPGTGYGYLATPPDRATGPGVLVLHAWWGLNETFRDLCDRLAGEGFVALAPDLYGDGGSVTTVEEAEARVGALDHVRAEQILLGAVERLTNAPEVPPHGLGVIGFSMGANHGLWLSGKRPDDIVSTVIAYGTGEAGEGRSAVQAHLAPDDEWEPREGVDEMVGQLRAAGRDVEVHWYPGTKHWFMEPDRPEYDPAAAQLAWERALAFLRAHLSEEAS